MSGLKEGELSEEGQRETADDVAGLFFTLPYVAGMGVTKGAVITFRGSVRLSQSVYNRIYNKAEKALKKEMEKMKKRIEDACRTSTVDISSLYKTPSIDEIKTQSLTEEQKRISSIEKLVSFLTKERKQRRAYEKQHGLRDDISKEIEEEIKRYRREKEKQENQMKSKEALIDKMSSDKDKKDILSLISFINNVCSLIGEFYPDIVKEIKAKLDSVTHDKRGLRTIVRRYKLEDKVNILKDPSVRENLLRVISYRFKYESSPFIYNLNEKTRDEFYNIFKRLREKAEKKTLKEKDFQDIEKILVRHFKEAEIQDREKRFKETVDKVKRGFSNRGYKRIFTRKTKDYLIVEGQKDDGRKARVSIVLPDIEDEKKTIIKIEVDEEGYKSVEEWNQEGGALAKELESLGIVINFNEMMTHFNGELLENAVNVLAKELKRKYPGEDFEVMIENSSYIMINGVKCYWGVNTKPSDIVSKYMETQKTRRIEERQRIKEEG